MRELKKTDDWVPSMNDPADLRALITVRPDLQPANDQWYSRRLAYKSMSRSRGCFGPKHDRMGTANMPKLQDSKSYDGIDRIQQEKEEDCQPCKRSSDQPSEAASGSLKERPEDGANSGPG
jgi:hypothetical protein